MGGILAVDTALILPNILGIISIDSPFFGLSSNVTRHGLLKAKEAITKTTSIISNTRGGWGMLAAGLTAAAAFVATQNVDTTIIKDHFDFLGPLWDVPNRTIRFKNMGFLFMGYYAIVDDKLFCERGEGEFEGVEYAGTDSIDVHMRMFGNGDMVGYNKLYSLVLNKLKSWQ